MADYTEDGEKLLSCQETEKRMNKIKKNYEGCKANGTLNELFHGKWKNAYWKMVDDCLNFASIYFYEATTHLCLIDSSNEQMMQEKYHELINSHAGEIKTSILHGDMEKLQAVAAECHDVFFDYYWHILLQSFSSGSESVTVQLNS